MALFAMQHDRGLFLYEVHTSMSEITLDTVASSKNTVLTALTNSDGWKAQRVI